MNEHGELVFPHPQSPDHIVPRPFTDDQVWTPTVLLAHQLAYYRSLADLTAEEPVTQAVVTVPAWWNQAQRRAYRDALELAGLQCLSMIGEGTGVGLNYAMTRTFPDFDPATGEGSKEYVVVYDSGALNTVATVLGFYQTSHKPSPKSKVLINTTHVEALGVGWGDVGALQFDVAVRDILVEDFIKKTGKTGVRDDSRAMLKLGREAVRVKQILSANRESRANIESLYDDIDFRTTVTRAELDEKFAGKMGEFMNPIKEALDGAGLELDDVSAVLLFGGNTRIPLVQSALRDVLGDKESLIAQNVNADEGAVLGAAFYAASLSRQFKMKSIEVQERSLWDVTLDGEVIFPRGTPQGSRKAVLLKPEDEMTLQIDQDKTPIISVSIPEVAGAVANFTGTSPAVNITVRYDARGIISVANVQLVSNGTHEEDSGGMAGAIKGLFGKKDKDGEEAASEEGEDAAEEATVAAPKTKPRVALKFREKVLGYQPLTGEAKKIASSRLSTISTYEKAMQAREEARNHLEGYLYKLQNMLEDELEHKAVQDFSTEAERNALTKLLAETFEWLHEYAESANVETLLGKKLAIETLENPIATRFEEYNARPDAQQALHVALLVGKEFVKEARANNTAALEAVKEAEARGDVAPPPKYTDAEIDDIVKLLKDVGTWFDENMKEQVKLHEDKAANPVIFVKDMEEKGKQVQSAVLRLSSRKAPRAPRKPKAKEPVAEEPAQEEPAPEATEEQNSEAPRHEEL